MVLRNLGRQGLNILGFALFVTGVLGLAVRLRRALFGGAGVLILSYHHVCRPEELDAPSDAVTPERFIDHVRLITRWFDVVSLEEAVHRLENRSLRRDAVVITFDDGYEDNHRYVLGILRRFGTPATVFVIAGLIDSGQLPWFDDCRRSLLILARHSWQPIPSELGSPAWRKVAQAMARRDQPARSIDEALSGIKGCQPAEREMMVALLREEAQRVHTGPHRSRLMTWSEARDMNAFGVTIGSHTVAHPLLTQLEAPEVERELRDSRARIAEELGCDCTSFAFPNGDFDDRILGALRGAGYRIACTQTFGINRPGCEPLALKRIAVGDIPSWTLALKLSGLVTPLFEWRDRLRNARKRETATQNSSCSTVTGVVS